MFSIDRSFPITTLATIGLCILEPACSSKSGVDTGNNSNNGGAGFILPLADSGTSATTTTTLKGGMTALTPDLLAQITNQACAGWSSEGENQPALLEIVLDTSGSMLDPAKNTNGQSKWAITASALENAINQLPSATHVGLLMFPDQLTVPNQNTTPIDVGICVNVSSMIAPQALGASGSAFRQTLTSAIQNAKVAGGTPTDDAYTYAYTNGLMPAVLANGGLRPYMVLITDGQPTIALGCEGTGAEAYPVDFQPIIDAITAAYATPNDPVETFVIGSPGSEEQSSTGADGRGNLSNAAAAGHTGPSGCSSTGGPEYCHFDMSAVPDFATGLQQALQSIAGQTLSCTYTIPPVTTGSGQIDASTINVIYRQDGNTTTSLLVGQADPNCTNGDGWYLDANKNIVLCPNTCSTVQHDANAVLNIYGGCKSAIVVN